ncbi:MAG TPA: hypothetical protein VLC46_08140 [Thermoanaerobaculia bacterium]|jgi:hypothetical protein|nr:hypothetical protein [Thermoanaerobaculia bacterium]
MTTREMLHVIVDRLPESELFTAARILTALDQPADALQILLANAPADDEPFDPADLEGTDEEPLISHDEVVHSLHE